MFVFVFTTCAVRRMPSDVDPSAEQLYRAGNSKDGWVRTRSRLCVVNEREERAAASLSGQGNPGVLRENKAGRGVNGACTVSWSQDSFTSSQQLTTGASALLQRVPQLVRMTETRPSRRLSRAHGKA